MAARLQVMVEKARGGGGKKMVVQSLQHDPLHLHNLCTRSVQQTLGALRLTCFCE